MPARKLSTSEAEQLRAFERQGHDALAATYHEFFAPVTVTYDPSTATAEYRG